MQEVGIYVNSKLPTHPDVVPLNLGNVTCSFILVMNLISFLLLFNSRYLLILFRDAPVEVWAMTKTPIMVNLLKYNNYFANFFKGMMHLLMIFSISMQLRSLALPFTVLEWTLPTVPRPAKERTTVTSDTASSPTKAPLSDSSKLVIYIVICNSSLLHCQKNKIAFSPTNTHIQAFGWLNLLASCML